MQIKNTRFNPTADGELHIGHMFVAKVNETVAHLSGGKFVVRFDDSQEVWRVRLGETRIATHIENMLADLKYMGIYPDEVCEEREMESEMVRRLKWYNGNDRLPVREQIWVNNSADIVAFPNMVAYPYHAYLTARKVIYDEISEINCLIRGIDLMTESSLYAYFCDLWGIPAPQQIYLPRIMDFDGAELSKSRNNPYSVRTMREQNIDPNVVWSHIASACLIFPNLPFTPDNIRPYIKYTWDKRKDV